MEVSSSHVIVAIVPEKSEEIGPQVLTLHMGWFASIPRRGRLTCFPPAGETRRPYLSEDRELTIEAPHKVIGLKFLRAHNPPHLVNEGSHVAVRGFLMAVNTFKHTAAAFSFNQVM